MARNCPSCGRANDDDARFCSGCGAEIASSEPVPAAAGFVAAAVVRQGNVLGTVTADGAVKELATTLGPQIFQIAYSPDGKRVACIAGDWKRPELSMLDVAQGTVQ